VLALITSPDKTSFYGEIGLGSRWYDVAVSGQSVPTYAAGEFALGAGLWIPVGRSVRILPKATIGFGTFGPPGSSVSSASSGSGSNEAHEFVMLGAAGYYSIDL